MRRGDCVTLNGQNWRLKPEKNGSPVYSIFLRVYSEYFGSAAQLHRLTRTRALIVGFVESGWLVKVTVTAAKVVKVRSHLHQMNGNRNIVCEAR
jgi:hypothetical protein